MFAPRSSHLSCEGTVDAVQNVHTAPPAAFKLVLYNKLLVGPPPLLRPVVRPTIDNDDVCRATPATQIERGPGRVIERALKGLLSLRPTLSSDRRLFTNRAH